MKNLIYGMIFSLAAGPALPSLVAYANYDEEYIYRREERIERQITERRSDLNERKKERGRITRELANARVRRDAAQREYDRLNCGYTGGGTWNGGGKNDGGKYDDGKGGGDDWVFEPYEGNRKPSVWDLFIPSAMAGNYNPPPAPAPAPPRNDGGNDACRRARMELDRWNAEVNRLQAELDSLSSDEYAITEEIRRYEEQIERLYARKKKDEDCVDCGPAKQAPNTGKSGWEVFADVIKAATPLGLGAMGLYGGLQGMKYCSADYRYYGDNMLGLGLPIAQSNCNNYGGMLGALMGPAMMGSMFMNGYGMGGGMFGGPFGGGFPGGGMPIMGGGGMFIGGGIFMGGGGMMGGGMMPMGGGMMMPMGGGMMGGGMFAGGGMFVGGGMMGGGMMPMGGGMMGMPYGMPMGGIGYGGMMGMPMGGGIYGMPMGGMYAPYGGGMMGGGVFAGGGMFVGGGMMGGGMMPMGGGMMGMPYGMPMGGIGYGGFSPYGIALPAGGGPMSGGYGMMPMGGGFSPYGMAFAPAAGFSPMGGGMMGGLGFPGMSPMGGGMMGMPGYPMPGYPGMPGMPGFPGGPNPYMNPFYGMNPSCYGGLCNYNPYMGMMNGQFQSGGWDSFYQHQQNQLQAQMRALQQKALLAQDAQVAGQALMEAQNRYYSIISQMNGTYYMGGNVGYGGAGYTNPMPLPGGTPGMPGPTMPGAPPLTPIRQ